MKKPINIKSIDNDILGFYVLKVFVYLLGIFQAALYTPIVLSFVLFIVIIPMLFQGDLATPLFSLLFGGGAYMVNENDVMAMYGKYAFGFSLIVAFTEIIFKKRLAINLKKKVLGLGLLLLIGYIFTFFFFITKSKFSLGETLLFLIPFFIFSLLAVLLSSLLSKLIRFLNNISRSS
ncbi:MAG: hypothetical protein NTV62_02535 [Candidatus Gribaldobacteria bacterium]|nr:hypothetical protein [Candidatus Gribaldobacteria bacterium]